MTGDEREARGTISPNTEERRLGTRQVEIVVMFKQGCIQCTHHVKDVPMSFIHTEDLRRNLQRMQPGQGQNKYPISLEHV